MSPPIPNRHRVMAEVVEWVGRNWTLRQIAARADMPSRQTLHRWAKSSPTFAQQLAAARRQARGEVRRLRLGAWEGYQEATAQAFLQQVRDGARVSDLVRRPEWPHRTRLDRWKAERPEFAAALAQAIGEARRVWRRRYDGRAADRALVAMLQGAFVARADGAAADGVRDMPCRAVVRRWRREDPEFDAACAAAQATGFRRRMRARSKCTPQLTAEIVERLRLGDTLHSVAKRPGMPHHVTLYAWVRSRPEFAAAVRQACADREDILFEQALMRREGQPPASVSREMARIGAVERRVKTMPRWPGGRGDGAR